MDSCTSTLTSKKLFTASMETAFSFYWGIIKLSLQWTSSWDKHRSVLSETASSTPIDCDEANCKPNPRRHQVDRDIGNDRLGACRWSCIEVFCCVQQSKPTSSRVKCGSHQQEKQVEHDLGQVSETEVQSFTCLQRDRSTYSHSPVLTTLLQVLEIQYRNEGQHFSFHGSIRLCVQTKLTRQGWDPCWWSARDHQGQTQSTDCPRLDWRAPNHLDL